MKCGMKLNGEWNNRCRFVLMKTHQNWQRRPLELCGHEKNNRHLKSTYMLCTVYAFCISSFHAFDAIHEIRGENPKQKHIQLFMSAKGMKIKYALNVDVWVCVRVGDRCNSVTARWLTGNAARNSNDRTKITVANRMTNEDDDTQQTN